MLFPMVPFLPHLCHLQNYLIYEIGHVTCRSTLHVNIEMLGRNFSTYKSRDQFPTNQHTFFRVPDK